MAEQAEQAFVKTFLNTLSTQPVTYADDYQQPSQNSLKRVPVLPIEVPAPPKRKQSEATASSSASISILFKSSKPPASFTISVHPTDTISSIKSQLAAEPSAPPVDAQRLVLKGKALADGKLLKEYNIQDGDTVNLMIKPGFDWDPSKPTLTSSPSPSSSTPEMSLGDRKPLSLNPTPGSKPSRHQRIPSVVLSPSPSNEVPGFVEKDILLTLDSSVIPPTVSTESLSTYGATIAQPEFWERLYAFLKSEFTTDSDTLTAFEDFLRASKGSLTASQIAKIRDQVGVVGMAGT
ncbi:ubiquitin-domain-containing protein [Collybia nuda]|uniref:Ubiquitin-domain-containing protein n=1 Tax=Collybia nuda TaxID=64659 RepID=A0A9P5XYL4_9AGAR|nr:ubiquitin-domain-containing protein [Collybia nuda]